MDENSSGVHDVHSGDSGGEARGHSPDSDPSADPDQEDGIDDVEVDSGREDSTWKESHQLNLYFRDRLK